MECAVHLGLGMRWSSPGVTDTFLLMAEGLNDRFRHRFRTQGHLGLRSRLSGVCRRPPIGYVIQVFAPLLLAPVTAPAMLGKSRPTSCTEEKVSQGDAVTDAGLEAKFRRTRETLWATPVLKRENASSQFR